MPAITELAPAKVNLTLKVLGRRPDGYHDIESLVAFARGLADVVSLVPGEGAGLRVVGPFARAIAGENLIERALGRLSLAEPRLVLGSVTLEKRLPVAAGLGGGSADAAALLRAVRRANPALAQRVDWKAIAAALGADVPVCLEGRPAFVRGAGEEVEALAALPRLDAVLANPLADTPAAKTARVFAMLGAQPVAPSAQGRLPPSLPDAAALLAYIADNGNDLAAAAAEVVPEIARVRAALAACPGCRYVGLSGAGPTSFGIFATADEAAAAAARLGARHPRWWIAAAALGG